MSRLLLIAALVTMAAWPCQGTHLGEMLLFDFQLSESVPDVMQTFREVHIFYKFKVFGINRYLVVVENDQSEGLKRLRMPDVAINVSVIPVETLDDFYSHVDPSYNRSNLVSLPENNLALVERIWSPEYSEKELTAILKEHAKLEKQKTIYDSQTFVATGKLPITKFTFLSLSDYDISELLLKNVDIYGGYKKVKTQTQKLIQL